MHTDQELKVIRVIREDQWLLLGDGESWRSAAGIGRTVPGMALKLTYLAWSNFYNSSIMETILRINLGPMTSRYGRTAAAIALMDSGKRYFV
jgi:hypothetical protein